MDKKKTRREFLKKSSGITVGFALGMLGDIKFNSKDGIKIGKERVSIGMAEALAACGSGLNCGGGGGMCGSGLNCGGGGGMCGSGLNCSGGGGSYGGGGQCGSGLNCGGGGGMCGSGLNCGGGGGMCGSGLNCSGN